MNPGAGAGVAVHTCVTALRGGGGRTVQGQTWLWSSRSVCFHEAVELVVQLADALMLATNPTLRHLTNYIRQTGPSVSPA